MPAKLTLEKVKKLFLDNNYELTSKTYKNSKSKLLCRCITCGHLDRLRANDVDQGKSCSNCRPNMARGKNNSSWKGGVVKLNLPLYNTYAKELNIYIEVFKIYKTIQNSNLMLLGVRCTYCKNIFLPTRCSVKHKIESIKGKNRGSNDFYCSEKCKQNCSTYGQISYPKGFKNYNNSRPLQSQWAKLVKERDNHICQICGKNEEIMIAHHIDPVSKNPIESADIDNGITLCKTCDKKVHQLPGCKTHELRCKK